MDSNKLFEDGFDRDKKIADPETGKQKVKDEMGFTRGVFGWVSNIFEMFGSIGRGFLDSFRKPNK